MLPCDVVYVYCLLGGVVFMFKNKGVKLTSSAVLLASASSFALHAQGGLSSGVVGNELLNKVAPKNGGNFSLKLFAVAGVTVLGLVALYYLAKAVVAYFRSGPLSKKSGAQSTENVSKNANEVEGDIEKKPEPGPVLQEKDEKSGIDNAEEGAGGQLVLDEKVEEKKGEEGFLISETPPPGGYYVDINENDVVSDPKNEEVQKKEPKVTISSNKHGEMLKSLEKCDKCDIGKNYESYSSSSSVNNEYLYLIQRDQFREIDKDGLCKEDFNKIDELENEALALSKSMAGSVEKVTSNFLKVCGILCQIQISVADKMHDQDRISEGRKKLESLRKIEGCPEITNWEDIVAAIEEVKETLGDKEELGDFCINVDKNLGLSEEGYGALKAVFENNTEENIGNFKVEQQYYKLMLCISECMNLINEQYSGLQFKNSRLDTCRNEWDECRLKIISFLKSDEVIVVPQKDNIDNDNNNEIINLQLDDNV